MDLQQIFDSRKEDPKWNTSYPLSPNDWAKYRVKEPLSFHNEESLSYYIHIPFCRQLCSFCEYSRMLCPDEYIQNAYLDALQKDIHFFVREHTDIPLRGFDIGGGTPTSLSDKNFHRLMQLFSDVIEMVDLTGDFEPSIETTFSTINMEKASSIVGAGIRRISLGLQSSSYDVLRQNHRLNTSLDDMVHTINMLHKTGLKKVNIDLMYGLKGQTMDSLKTDISTIKYLNPEQVTLYELRINMINEDAHLSKEGLFEQYTFLYDGLTNLGYKARFGQNTFSKNSFDMGVSSYLRDRMLNGGSYVGFGISAQSMCKEGVAYNIGKIGTSIRDCISFDSFPQEYIYHLPKQELEAKYIAIGGYNGSFSLDKINMEDDNRKSVLKFCISNGYMYIDNDNRCVLTRKGFRYYGALLSLWYKQYE